VAPGPRRGRPRRPRRRRSGGGDRPLRLCHRAVARNPRPALRALRGAGLARPARPPAPRCGLGGCRGRGLDGDGRLLALGHARPAAPPVPGGRPVRAVLGGHAPPLRRPGPAGA
jgi:hypothetical protein